MPYGPEAAQIIAHFDDEYFSDNGPDDTKNVANHDTEKASQRRFHHQVHSLVDVIQSMDNPFLDDFPHVVVLDSRDSMDVSAAETVRSFQDTYDKYLIQVVVDQTKSIHEPLKKNNLTTFKIPHQKTTSKQQEAISTLQNVAFFAQLYIAMQSRESDLEEFFLHEIQSFPPFMSEFGKLCFPTVKSDLQCLPDVQQPQTRRLQNP